MLETFPNLDYQIVSVTLCAYMSLIYHNSQYRRRSQCQQREKSLSHKAKEVVREKIVPRKIRKGSEIPV